MKLKLPRILRVFLILAVCSAPVLGNIAEIFDSFGAINCEEEMARLDNLAIGLQSMPDARAYIFIYGGKRGTYRDEVRVRGARMKRYLIESRGLDPNRIELINGGYRESFSIEIWIFPGDDPAPSATPTVNAKTVRFKKGKMPRNREPGCFPGKYLTSKFHHNQMQVNN